MRKAMPNSLKSDIVAMWKQAQKMEARNSAIRKFINGLPIRKNTTTADIKREPGSFPNVVLDSPHKECARKAPHPHPPITLEKRGFSNNAISPGFEFPNNTWRQKQIFRAEDDISRSVVNATANMTDTWCPKDIGETVARIRSLAGVGASYFRALQSTSPTHTKRVRRTRPQVMMPRSASPTRLTTFLTRRRFRRNRSVADALQRTAVRCSFDTIPGPVTSWRCRCRVSRRRLCDRARCQPRWRLLGDQAPYAAYRFYSIGEERPTARAISTTTWGAGRDLGRLLRICCND